MEKEKIGISIYGDSILRATVPDATMKYHYHFQDFLGKFASIPVNLVNRARFGATVEKGRAILNADMDKGLASRYALLEFGGNDCDFHWEAIAADPAGEHLPNTSLEHFKAVLGDMADTLLQKGVTPVLMTLPPIDAQRYFDFITRKGASRENILHWLGDTNMIYRFQELYSDAAARVAQIKGLTCLDVRALLLRQHDFYRLISADGIHLSEAGYDLLFSEFAEVLRKKLTA